MAAGVIPVTAPDVTVAVAVAVVLLLECGGARVTTGGLVYPKPPEPTTVRPVMTPSVSVAVA